MRVTAFRPVLGPTAIRLEPAIRVTEQLGKWIKGRMRSDPSVAVELSFELTSPLLPNTPYCYLGLFTSRKVIFEFQLGKLLVFHPEAAPHVQAIVDISKGLRPIAVNDRPPQYVIDMREQAFQLSRQRCIEARP